MRNSKNELVFKKLIYCSDVILLRRDNVTASRKTTSFPFVMHLCYISRALEEVREKASDPGTRQEFQLPCHPPD